MNRRVLPMVAVGLLSLSMVAVAAPAAMAVPSYCSASQDANSTGWEFRAPDAQTR